MIYKVEENIITVFVISAMGHNHNRKIDILFEFKLAPASLQLVVMHGYSLLTELH